MLLVYCALMAVCHGLSSNERMYVIVSLIVIVTRRNLAERDLRTQL